MGGWVCGTRGSLFVKNCTVASRIIIAQVISPFLSFSISSRSPKAAIDLATLGILLFLFFMWFILSPYLTFFVWLYRLLTSFVGIRRRRWLMMQLGRESEDIQCVTFSRLLTAFAIVSEAVFDNPFARKIQGARKISVWSAIWLPNVAGILLIGRSSVLTVLKGTLSLKWR